LFKSLLRLTKHSAIYGVGHILSRTIGFLLLPLHTNFITPEEYAVYIYGYAFIPFIAIFYSAGINSAQLRYYILTEEKQEKDKILTTSFIGTVVIAFAFSFFLFAFSKSVSLFVLGNERFGYLIRISCGILIFDALLLLLFNILRGQEKSIQYVSFSILNVVVNITLNVILIVKLNMGIDGVFIANLAASAVTFFVLLLVTKNHFSRRFSYPLFRELFNFGLPLIPSTLGMIILIAIDRFIIRHLMGNEAAAIYGAGYKLGMFMSLIVTAFRYAWHPFYLSTVREEDDAKQIFSKVLTYFVFLCGAIFLLIALFIDEIVRFKMFGFTMFGEQYWPGVKIVPAILASYIFYGIYLNFQIGTYIENQTKYLAFTTVLSALINIAANFLFIPQLGLMGAAYATLIAYIFMAVSIYFYANKFYPVQYEWLRISKIFVTVGLLYITGTLSYPNKPLLFKAIFIPAYFIVLYFTGFFEKREINKIKEFILGKKSNEVENK